MFITDDGIDDEWLGFCGICHVPSQWKCIHEYSSGIPYTDPIDDAEERKIDNDNNNGNNNYKYR